MNWFPSVKLSAPVSYTQDCLCVSVTTNFQPLMPSPNLLKFQSPIYGGKGGGGVGDNQFPTFDAESKSAKIPKSHYGGKGGGVGDNQFPTFDAESKSTKIPKSHYGGWGESVMTIFQPLMPSPNLLKFQSPIMVGKGGSVTTNFHLLMLSLNLLKS